MSTYLVVKDTENNKIKSYLCTSSADKPYIKVNSEYLPLTTETGTGWGLRIKNGEDLYSPNGTFITTTSYYRSSKTASLYFGSTNAESTQMTATDSVSVFFTLSGTRSSTTTTGAQAYSSTYTSSNYLALISLSGVPKLKFKYTFPYSIIDGSSVYTTQTFNVDYFTSSVYTFTYYHFTSSGNTSSYTSSKLRVTQGTSFVLEGPEITLQTKQFSAKTLRGANSSGYYFQFSSGHDSLVLSNYWMASNDTITASCYISDFRVPGIPNTLTFTDSLTTSVNIDMSVSSKSFTVYFTSSESTPLLSVYVETTTTMG